METLFFWSSDKVIENWTNVYDGCLFQSFHRNIGPVLIYYELSYFNQSSNQKIVMTTSTLHAD